MASAADDEMFEINSRSYQKIEENLEKSGYKEGITEGRNSLFQQSFDHGYEDGFRIGFTLGKAQKEKAGRGNCAICADGSFMEKPETEARDIHRRQFEQETNPSS